MRRSDEKYETMSLYYNTDKHLFDKIYVELLIISGFATSRHSLPGGGLRITIIILASMRVSAVALIRRDAGPVGSRAPCGRLALGRVVAAATGK
jgi:hypothetical protein